MSTSINKKFQKNHVRVLVLWLEGGFIKSCAGVWRECTLSPQPLHAAERGVVILTGDKPLRDTTEGERMEEKGKD